MSLGATLYPLTFQPIFKERVWGGRNLERLYQKPIPTGQAIGESWEISDRPEEASIIANGPLSGKSLRWLMEHHRKDVLGSLAAPTGVFPLLIKILDAKETLSVQVHPPATAAAQSGGEPKTEMWFITDATPDAALYVGLRQGVTREEFERRIADGTVADCLHRIGVHSGDAMFLPSGRLHAIGALQRMKRKGWVRSEWRVTDNNRRARYYEMTRAGERQLAKERADWERTSAAVNGILDWQGSFA
jgi:mannose-6-phosphate isomerase